ncbi:uncharacterized protein BDV17DRAFT_291106 [Aspergillus undulatus]|uniref:uncharacterized protein n=1 Tax=Aspergillus undulatus TaxID=1810928 RepID=UPI003CCE4328
MSLNRFRNTNTSTSTSSRNLKHQSLYEISLPAAPKPAHARSLYKHSRVTVSPSTSFEDTDDNIIPLTGSSISSQSSKSSTSSSSSGSGSLSLPLPVSRKNSFTMKTLDPRRLSMRLKSSASTSRPNSPLSSSRDSNDTISVNRAHTDPLPLPSSSSSSSSGRAEFIYKPIRRTDYTTVVAETAIATAATKNYNHTYQPTSSSRYQYNHISSGPGRANQSLPAAPRPRARAQAHYAHALDDEEDNLYNDLDEEYAASRPREYAIPVADMYSSAAERKRVRAARRMTTVMVPDAEDIYG